MRLLKKFCIYGSSSLLSFSCLFCFNNNSVATSKPVRLSKLSNSLSKNKDTNNLTFEKCLPS